MEDSKRTVGYDFDVGDELVVVADPDRRAGAVLKIASDGHTGVEAENIYELAGVVRMVPYQGWWRGSELMLDR